jgi:hypothetical protein
MAEKTVQQQPNEMDARLWSQTRVKACYVCKQPFNEDDNLYVLKSHRFLGRHTTCARNVTGVLPPPQTEEEYLEQQRRNRRSTGSDKRQRTGGHGYSGGTGFKDL